MHAVSQVMTIGKPNIDGVLIRLSKIVLLIYHPEHKQTTEKYLISF